MNFGLSWFKRKHKKNDTELDYLIEVLSSPDIAARINLAHELGCFVAEQNNSRAEKECLKPVFELLTCDPEPEVQVALAKAICQSKYVLPRGIVFKVAAEGCEEAASILLKQSPLMSEKLMKHLVQKRVTFRHRCIASRAGLTVALTTMLIKHCDEEVLVHLLHNEAADIDEAGYRRLLMRFPDSAVVCDLIGERPLLPAVVSEMLVSLATDRMRDAAIDRGWMEESVAEELAIDLRERFTLEIAEKHDAEDGLKLVQALHQSKRLTTTLLLRAACCNNMRFVEDGLTKASRLPIDRVVELLYSGPMGVGAVAARADFDAASTLILTYAFEVHQEMQFFNEDQSGDRFSKRLIERVLNQSTELDAHEQKKLLNLMKRFTEGDNKVLAEEVIEAIDKAA
jgi:uncharacterized protein (DUF2336 family)